MKFASVFTAATMIAVAACSQSPEEPTDAQATGVEEAIAHDGEPTEQHAEIQSLETQGAIPAKFHGVWDYEMGTCALESDLRVEISGSEMIFYESYGKVSGAREDGEDAIVDMAMEGEGETWVQSYRLSRAGSGSDQRLHITEATEQKGPSDLPRKRCPA